MARGVEFSATDGGEAMDNGFEGQVILVTGAGRGLGRAAAARFATAGVRVAMADVNGESAREGAEALSSFAETHPIEVDVADAASVGGMVDEVIARFGQIDVLVHCAGIARGAGQRKEDGSWLPMEQVSEADWRAVIEINLTGTFLVNRAVASVMIPAGYGRIVNVGSMSGMIANKGLPGLGPYAASKGGVIALTTVLAVEWADHGITVNCISPGYMATEMGKRSQSIPGFRDLQLSSTPLGRLGEPSEFAHAVSYLASREAAFITGHNLVIDGGYTAW